MRIEAWDGTPSMEDQFDDEGRAMSEMKHTPGPWRVLPSRDASGDVGITADGLPNILAEAFADIRHDREYNLSEAAANARLIAAAPDLLKCAEILSALESEDGGRGFPTKQDCAFARAALKLAREA